MVFTKEEKALFDNLEAKKATIQAKLNGLNDEIKEAAKAEQAVRVKVAKLKPELVPYAEMQAAMASATSRDKYYPEHTKATLIDHIKEALK